MREVIKGLIKDKISLVALCVLFILYILIFFASFIAIYDKDFSSRSMSYAPPSNIYWITPEGKLTRPYTYNIKNFNQRR